MAKPRTPRNRRNAFALWDLAAVARGARQAAKEYLLLQARQEAAAARANVKSKPSIWEVEKKNREANFRRRVEGGVVFNPWTGAAHTPRDEPPDRELLKPGENLRHSTLSPKEAGTEFPVVRRNRVHSPLNVYRGPIKPKRPAYKDAPLKAVYDGPSDELRGPARFQQPTSHDAVANEALDEDSPDVVADEALDEDDLDEWDDDVLEEPPPDVNTNVFRTPRGSRILESLGREKDNVKPAPKREVRYPAPWADVKSSANPGNEASAQASSQSQLSSEMGDTGGESLLGQPDPSSETSMKATSLHQSTSRTETNMDATPHSQPASGNEASAGASLQDQPTLGNMASAAATPQNHPAPAKPEAAAPQPADNAAQPNPLQTRAYELRESKVPATRVGRLWNYGGLAAGMLGGALTESLTRVVGGGGGGGGQGSVMLSPANMERLVSRLSRMRGAALKMGQMMSFQDAKMLPGPIHEVLQRVQDRADYMPSYQRDKVLVANLGADWRELFSEFEEKPIAAASIGQVHRATLRSNGKPVAVKIQFPGVADSINSDLDNLGVLLTATKLLPKGLYLDKTIDNARTELGWECDYAREAACLTRFGSLMADEADAFRVPAVHAEASGKQVLTMDFMRGEPVTRLRALSQAQRDWIGTQILRLCLREITEFRFMQTDPNWTNFLYNAPESRLELLDFGASREYPEAFVAQYVRLLEAASRTDRGAVKALSEGLGYLTGLESRTMLDAHVGSVLTLAEPFLGSAPEVYDFHDQTITERVKGFIPVMLKERLAPPPEETYSLHRKLSGAFLLCARLGSRVRCRELFQDSLKKGGFLSS